MSQLIKFGKDSRQEIYEGVKTVNDAVKVTLGPMGKCVIISELYAPKYDGIYKPLQVSKDGYRVAKSINIVGSLQNIGQRLIQEAAQKTVDQAGDGTTTTCILMEAIVREGLAAINEGANSQELKKGIDAAVEYVVAQLKEMAVPVKGDVEKIRQIATISANNDTVIGDIIAKAFEQIGDEGTINLEESSLTTTEIKITEGYKFANGYTHPYFATNKVKEICEFDNPLIVLYEKRIVNHVAIEAALNISVQAQRPLLIVCEDADAEGLAFLAMNNFQGNFKCCVVKSPSFGELRLQEMDDIATVTGGTYINDTKGAGLKDITFEMMGKAKKVIVSKDETVIIGGEGNKEDLLNGLRETLKEAKTEEEKYPIEQRIAKINAGVAVIKVGASTETEMKEKLDRFDDAVRATKSAIAEGYVAGGGSVFYNLAGSMSEKESGDLIIKNALLSPLHQIWQNAVVDVQSLVSKIDKTKGYNAKTGVIEDLVLAGVIDPVKVLRCAIQNAASAACNILISEAVIADTQN